MTHTARALHGAILTTRYQDAIARIRTGKIIPLEVEGLILEINEEMAAEGGAKASGALLQSALRVLSAYRTLVEEILRHQRLGAP